MTEKTESFNVCQIVLDKSGSMMSKATQTVDGFNEFKNGLPKGTRLSLTLFDTDIYHAHEVELVEDVPDLVHGTTYIPSGSTALHDAFMEAALALEKFIENSPTKPDHVTFVVLTDGEENSSRNKTLKDVKDSSRRTRTTGTSSSWEPTSTLTPLADRSGLEPDRRFLRRERWPIWRSLRPATLFFAATLVRRANRL